MNQKPQILIDSDSCPRTIRDIIVRACIKNDLNAVFAADRNITDISLAISAHTRDKRLSFIAAGGSREEAKSIKSLMVMHIVPTADNSADDYLVDICQVPCLAITRDILLASRLIEKGATVITDRGQILDTSNIRHRLSEKNANSIFREAGLFETEQNKSLSASDVRQFASSFNALLFKLLQ